MRTNALQTLFTIMLCLAGFLAGAQNKDSFQTESLTVPVDTHLLSGTLTLPDAPSPYPLVLIVAGSGPVNRDGNQPGMKADTYKQLASALAKEGIATLRYDKRGVGESIYFMDEINLRFDQYIEDAEAWMNKLHADKRFSKVVVAGHSEGSLIGILACAKSPNEGFISIAGAARPIDDLLRIQLKAAVPDSGYYALCCTYLDTLKQGQLLTYADPALAALFRPSIQPYMINWMKYNPSGEIKKLKVPVLILQGENDIQVEPENAKELARAVPKAVLKIIPGMNHVLKPSVKDREKNFETYSDPSLTVMQELVDEITRFVKR